MKRARAETVNSALPDIVAPNLRILFCGINPGFVSAAAGAHFANPRNDFWRLLHAARLTPRLLTPAEQHALLDHGLGVTNAAPRATRGSGDLRRVDFAGARERLERLAGKFAPEWIGFVGKEAYRGVFGERPELGLQHRLLGDTRLFVLPSTSPANAAVPWHERERWFQELAGRATGLPLRPAVRAVVLDDAGRVLLVRFEWPHKTVWAPPGGGLEPGETDEQAIRRELTEESGLYDFELGPCVWRRAHWFSDMSGWGGQVERHYLVRTAGFEPAPAWSAESLALEGIAGQRWWSVEELADSRELFAPRRLPRLLRDLLSAGPPPEPVDVGV